MYCIVIEMMYIYTFEVHVLDGHVLMEVGSSTDHTSHNVSDIRHDPSHPLLPPLFTVQRIHTSWGEHPTQVPCI